MQDIIEFRLFDVPKRRKPFQKRVEMAIQNRFDLGLLQHHFTDIDDIRIVRIPPWKIVASIGGIPLSYGSVNVAIIHKEDYRQILPI